MNSIIQKIEDGSYVIDQDGTHFRYILNYLRTGELIVPNDEITRRELLAEAKFYQVEGMINELESTPCISRSNPSCSSTVQGFSDSLVQSGTDFDELVEEHTRRFRQR